MAIPGNQHSTAYLAGIGAAALGVPAHDNPFHPVREHEACSDFGRGLADGDRWRDGGELEDAEALQATINRARAKLANALGCAGQGKSLGALVDDVLMRLPRGAVVKETA